MSTPDTALHRKRRLWSLVCLAMFAAGIVGFCALGAQAEADSRRVNAAADQLELDVESLLDNRTLIDDVLGDADEHVVPLPAPGLQLVVPPGVTIHPGSRLVLTRAAGGDIHATLSVALDAGGQTADIDRRWSGRDMAGQLISSGGSSTFSNGPFQFHAVNLSVLLVLIIGFAGLVAAGIDALQRALRKPEPVPFAEPVETDATERTTRAAAHHKV